MTNVSDKALLKFFEWIKTKDCLPNDGERVLIKLKDGGCWSWEVSVWNGHYLCWDTEDGDDFMYKPEEVECWMRIKD